MPAQHRNLTLASHFLVIERPQRARDYLQNATIEERETPRYFYLLADSYFQEQNYEASKAATKDGLAIYPEDYQLLQVLTNCYINLDEYDSAETNVIRALEIYPESATLHFQYAHLEWKLKRYDSAETILEKAHTLNPQNAYVHRLRALIAAGRKEWDSAEAHATALIKDNPQNARSHHLMADIYRWQARRLESEQYLKRAAELNPASGAVAQLRADQQHRTNMGSCLFIFCIVGYALMAFVGLMAYWQEGVTGGLIAMLVTVPIALLIAYAFVLERTPLDIQKSQLVLGREDRQRIIPFSTIVDMKNSQFGIKIFTADKTHRIYRLDQNQQSDLFVKLRNLVPATNNALADRLEEPLPFRVYGFYGSLAGSLFLMGCSLIILYAGYYTGWVEAEYRADIIEWLRVGFVMLMALFVLAISIWWFGSTAWWWSFSAETIKTRYPFKTKTYDATQIEHVGLKRGYRMYKGNQMLNMSIEIHLKDGEIITIDQDSVRRPAGDWSPLYELTARLQTQYNATAPHHSADTISPYIL